MPVQVETRGQLQEFVEILGRRKWQVLLPFLFLATIGAAAAVLVPRKFLITTQVELRPVSVSVSTKESTAAAYQVKSTSRVRKVIQDLKNTARGAEYLALSPEEQNEFVKDLQDDVKIALGKDSTRDGGANFVTITYADVDRDWGVMFLRALREDWIQDVLEIDRNKVQDEAKKLQEEGSKLDKQIEQEEKTLTELKRLNGISPTQPIPGGEGLRGEDPVYARLQKNRDLKSGLELELVQIDAEIKALEDLYQDLPERLSKEELLEGDSNAGELAALELEYIAVQQQMKKYKQAHSKYLELQRTLGELDDRREQLTRLVTRAEVQSTTTENPARAEARAEIDKRKLDRAALEARIKKLASEIDSGSVENDKLQPIYMEIRERTARIERLRDARRNAELRYQEKVQHGSILSSPLSSPFQITQDVQAPQDPTEPNPWLIVAFSVIAGLGLGVGLAVVLEYSKNCFRSVGDINRVMVVPVLGSIGRIVTRREARRATARRVLVGMSSAALLGAVIFVTWAWKVDPELLSWDVREKIELLRDQFR